MSYLIPAERLRETTTLVAFYHPKPSYPLHILLVPKKGLRSLNDLGAADTAFMADLFATVQSLVAEFNLEVRYPISGRSQSMLIRLRDVTRNQMKMELLNFLISSTIRK